MGKTNARLDVVRRAYREALESARANPTPEAWAKLLAAGKELSSAQEPKNRGGRRNRRTAAPTYQELEGPARGETHEVEQLD
jgi:hypothetical protein